MSESLNIISGAKIAHMDGQCRNDNPCSASELANYVDGVTLPEDVNVFLSSNVWSIESDELASVTGQYAVTVTNGAYREEDIKAVLDPQ